jgi:hypothetical protein
MRGEILAEIYAEIMINFAGIYPGNFGPHCHQFFH